MRLLPTLVIIVSFFIFPSLAYAKVVINEFSSNTSSDWIELYSDTDVDISGWIIQDTTSIVETIDSGTFIGPLTSSYLVINVSKRLNQSGDIIKLLQSDDSTLVDEIGYGDKGDLCLPADDGSIGRSPDGTGSFTRYITSTPGAENSSTTDPCPTPTPSLDPSPSPTPESSNSQEDPSTSTPTSTPTTSLRSTNYKITTTPPKSEGEVAGASEAAKIDLSSFTINPSPSPDMEESTSRSFPLLPVVSGSLLFGGAGIYGFQKYRANKKQLKKKQDSQV